MLATWLWHYREALKVSHILIVIRYLYIVSRCLRATAEATPGILTNREVTMTDIAFREEGLSFARPRTHWGAIWAGMFAFVAIWSVFGLLGEAIFASAANPNATAPVSGMSVGMGIWSVILTIIAMYVGGRVTGALAGVTTRHEGTLYGMTMFGLSVIATIVMVILGGAALSGATGVAGSPHSPYMLTVFSDIGWIGFVSLFLGWLAAMGGAAHAVQTQVRTLDNVRDIRPAA